jgi:hypothetical protein
MSDEADELVRRLQQAIAALSAPPLAKGGQDRVAEVGKAFNAIADNLSARMDHLERQSAQIKRLDQARLPPGGKPNGHLLEGAQ